MKIFAKHVTKEFVLISQKNKPLRKEKEKIDVFYNQKEV